MENEILSSLSEIKTILYILLGVFILIFLFICYIFYFLETKGKKIMGSEEFNIFTEEKLDQGKYDEVIQDSLEFLQNRPHHTYAQWYLAKAYYYTNDYENAKIYFEKILEKEPGWENSVKPYLDGMNTVKENESI